MEQKKSLGLKLCQVIFPTDDEEEAAIDTKPKERRIFFSDFQLFSLPWPVFKIILPQQDY